MGLLDALLGGRRRLQLPARDRLFAITTAQVTLESSLGLAHRDHAGIVFQALPTADFQTIVRDAEELLASAARDSGTEVSSADDQFGFRWIVLRNGDFDELVVAINMVSSELEGGGYGDRLLAAVFPFAEGGRTLYLIYNFKRGLYYPFAPGTAPNSRDNERELRLQAQVGGELPIEPELNRWFPLWDMPL